MTLREENTRLREALTAAYRELSNVDRAHDRNHNLRFALRARTTLAVALDPEQRP